MQQSRRTFLTQASLGALLWSATARGDDAVGPRAARLLQQYDSQGLHRTGTTGDQRSARWLAAEVQKLGGKPQLESFAHNRIDPVQCFVECDGKRIVGLPLFDASFTSATGVRGKLGVFGSDAELGVIELPPNAEYGATYESMRRNSRHQALIIVTKGTRPGLCPINGAWFTQPFGAPALQISSEHGDWLQQRLGTTAHLVAHVKRTKTQAHNVTATIPGTNASLAPLVVMTPRSGWWHCTGERGGGLICWLEVMRAVRANKPARTVHFVASSGHELGHLGLDHFIEQRPQLVKQAHVWMHFGANIGAVGATNRLQAFDDALEAVAAEAMTNAGITINDKARRGVAPLGEASNIHRGGGRYVSLLCPGSPLFHHPNDRWPAAVDVASVVRYAETFARVAVKLASG